MKTLNIKQIGNSASGGSAYKIVLQLPQTGVPDIIYLVRKKEDATNKFTEYIWIDNQWEVLGDAVINADVSELYNMIDELGDEVSDNTLRWGHYTERPDIVLSAVEINKAISKDGVKISKSGWAIAEFTAVKGNEYFMKVGTTDGNVCLFAEKITKVETRNIDYAFTYNDDGTIATAKATYGGATHSYTYSYEYDEESSQLISETITDDQTHAIINSLPYQYRTSVGSYQPMTILNEDAELPEDGYCRLVSHFQNDQSLKVVVSFNTTDADLTMKVVRDGFTASICTQLSNLAKRISNLAEHAADVDIRLEEVIYCVDSVADSYGTCENVTIPLLCGQPMILFGNGTPQESVVPTNWRQYDPISDTGYQWNGSPSAIGQQYINTSASSGGRYIAVADANMNLTWKNF